MSSSSKPTRSVSTNVETPCPQHSKSERIRILNDNVRRTFTGGIILVTPGVQALDDDTKAQVLSMVREFNAFDGDNDPHQEHDFGGFDAEGRRVFFKIDYFDESLTYHSPDPADPSVTKRVITIMLAEEY